MNSTYVTTDMAITMKPRNAPKPAVLGFSAKDLATKTMPIQASSMSVAYVASAAPRRRRGWLIMTLPILSER